MADATATPTRYRRATTYVGLAIVDNAWSLSRSAQDVLMAIATMHRRGETRINCWPSDIPRYMLHKISDPTLKRALGELIAQGVVISEERSKTWPFASPSHRLSIKGYAAAMMTSGREGARAHF